MVGKKDGQPFELFAGRSVNRHPDLTSGYIKRVERSKYAFLTLEEEVILEDISSRTSDEQEALLRSASALLQRGASILDLVHILEKTKGNLSSFCKALCRALKGYIPEGTKEDEPCPSCASESLVRREGCVSCLSCGFSKC